jgi:hypothetical protein
MTIASSARSPPPQDPVDTDVPCPICRELIKRGARKCIHCDSALDWRRWLGVSETTLALLVALVTVIGATAPRIAELFTPKSSDLRLSVRQVNAQNLEMIGWNQGHMTSQVQSARISATTKSGKVLEAIPLQILGAPSVLAEQQTYFGLQVPPAAIPTFLDWPHTEIDSASLVVVVDEYKKPPETRTLSVPMDFFRLFCRATEDSDRVARHANQAPTDDPRTTSRCVSHAH